MSAVPFIFYRLDQLKSKPTPKPASLEGAVLLVCRHHIIGAAEAAVTLVRVERLNIQLTAGVVLL